MDPRLLHLYSQELGHLREMGQEFAREFPRIASRLGMEGLEVSDPFVERLLEGFAFLAARVQLKLEAEQPRLIAHLLEAIYPNFLAPLPSMMVARYEIDPADPNLARGHRVPRGSAIVCDLARGQDTHCEYRSAHEVALWPLELLDVRYFSLAADLPLARLPQARSARGGLRIRLRCGGGLMFHQLQELDRLAFYISAPDATAFRLHELLGSAVAGTLVREDAGEAISARDWRGPQSIQPLGFAADQALLPESLRTFSGYRLLQEVASMPQRLLFFEITELAERLARTRGDTVELVVFLQRGDARLEPLVDAASLALFCTPAINLFRKRLDRITLGPGDWEHHLVPDRARPMDYEVHSVESVTGFGSGRVARQDFAPLYATYQATPPAPDAIGAGYYTLRREPRLPSSQQQAQGVRSSYIGEEVYLSLVDPRHAPYAEELRQISVEAWVSNRDLPTLLPVEADDKTAPRGSQLWHLDSPGPVLQVRALRSPTRPRSRLPVGELGWQLVNHLTLNHLSLVGESPAAAAASLRTMLGLYAPADEDAGWRRQTEGVRALSLRRVVRRLPFDGPPTFGSGVAIELELDELAFEGNSAFLFASTLERFFARHAAINSFTQLSLRTPQRGELMRWPPHTGLREAV
ncbi:type VI secretion system baseplate subunit TssF [Paucibacter sp. R3-3]|uniref:Type VI secretion system baseplate subunit TssF n=1 Tax=Roseateles agri TaxID=3098619 RepID=A0ABU5DAH3_9BURK|nr:type VI secretion system baseplate subunit TssF [Paucibacter sp. R3-3]MDY0743282.1 type VI secretion system baseplate subunit TssF [Paucibacter sp. R3-3]